MQNHDIKAVLQETSKPDVALPKHTRELRLTLIHARRAAWWSVLLVLFPVLFVTTALLKYMLGVPVFYDLLNPVFTWIDAHPGGVPIAPLVFFGGLFVAFVLNVLAVLHISAKAQKDSWIWTISIHKRWPNLIFVGVSVLFALVLLTYALLENWPCIIGQLAHC